MCFQQPDAFTLVQFRLECGPGYLLKWFERSDLHPSRMHFGGIYTWSFQDRIDIRSEKNNLVS